MKMLFSKLASEMCHYYRISLRNKVQKGGADKRVGQREIRKHLVGLPTSSHKIGGLGTFKVLIIYLTQTSLMMTMSKL